ncbi:MAG: hypothetical protein WBF53_10300 [Litorimonas sp.]
MSTLNDDINTAATTATRLAADMDETLGQLAAERAAVRASHTQMLDELAATSTRNALFVHETLGDDANNGSSGAPLKTVAEAVARAQSHRPTTIRLASDVVWDRNIEIVAPSCSLAIMGWDIAAVAHVRRQIRFADTQSAQSTSLLMANVHGVMSFLSTDFLLDLQVLTSAFLLHNTDLNLHIRNCSVAQTAGNIAPLFANSFASASSLKMTASLLTLTGAEDAFIGGVSAGQDPNDQYWITTNLTTL